MVGQVYKHNKLFGGAAELEATICGFWDSIDHNDVFHLYRSIPKRMMAMMYSKGKSKKY